MSPHSTSNKSMPIAKTATMPSKPTAHAVGSKMTVRSQHSKTKPTTNPNANTRLSRCFTTTLPLPILGAMNGSSSTGKWNKSTVTPITPWTPCCVMDCTPCPNMMVANTTTMLPPTMAKPLSTNGLIRRCILRMAPQFAA